jgi:hypothetical protein
VGIIAHSVLLKDAKNIHILYTARKEDAHEGNSNEKESKLRKMGIPLHLAVFSCVSCVPAGTTGIYILL